MNMTKLEFIRKYRLTENQFNGVEPIEDDLDLSELTELPEEWSNIWVTGDLYLSNIKSINTEVNFRIGGSLYLNSLTKIKTDIRFNVGWSLFLDSLTEITSNCTFNVGGYLSLRSLTNISTNCTFNVRDGIYNNHDLKFNQDNVNKEKITKKERSYPRVMLVSDFPDFPPEKTITRVVFMEKNGKFLAWNNAETLEEAEREQGILYWGYAKEIEEVTPIELTIDQIAEKFNVKPENLKIIK